LNTFALYPSRSKLRGIRLKNKEDEKNAHACIQDKIYRILSSFLKWLGSLIKATWFWRRILPLFLCVYWILWGGVLDYALRSLMLYLPQK
jgi:hypothetical protein